MAERQKNFGMDIASSVLMEASFLYLHLPFCSLVVQFVTKEVVLNVVTVGGREYRRVRLLEASPASAGIDDRWDPYLRLKSVRPLKSLGYMRLFIHTLPLEE